MNKPNEESCVCGAPAEVDMGAAAALCEPCHDRWLAEEEELAAEPYNPCCGAEDRAVNGMCRNCGCPAPTGDS